MISIEAPETGPVPEQREFLQCLRARLPYFEERARDYLRDHVDRPVDVSLLSVYSIEIGGAKVTSREEFVLELSDQDEIEIHRVSMRQ